MSTSTTAAGESGGEGQGPKYEINIEGVLHHWDAATITIPKIRELGDLPQDLPVIEVDLKTNEERTLPEDEIVDLKPGQGFGRKISFKRG